MTSSVILAEIIGPDILIVLVVGLLFGSARLPKLARSLGSAKAEFEKGIKDGPNSAAPSEEKVTMTPWWRNERRRPAPVFSAARTLLETDRAFGYFPLK